MRPALAHVGDIAALYYIPRVGQAGQELSDDRWIVAIVIKYRLDDAVILAVGHQEHGAGCVRLLSVNRRGVRVCDEGRFHERHAPDFVEPLALERDGGPVPHQLEVRRPLVLRRRVLVAVP